MQKQRCRETKYLTHARRYGSRGAETPTQTRRLQSSLSQRLPYTTLCAPDAQYFAKPSKHHAQTSPHPELKGSSSMSGGSTNMLPQRTCPHWVSPFIKCRGWKTPSWKCLPFSPFCVSALYNAGVRALAPSGWIWEYVPHCFICIYSFLPLTQKFCLLWNIVRNSPQPLFPHPTPWKGRLITRGCNKSIQKKKTGPVKYWSGRCWAVLYLGKRLKNWGVWSVRKAEAKHFVHLSLA